MVGERTLALADGRYGDRLESAEDYAEHYQALRQDTDDFCAAIVHHRPLQARDEEPHQARMRFSHNPLAHSRTASQGHSQATS